MAIHKGPTPAVMLIAARLARIHMAFTVEADPLGNATLTCQHQEVLDAAIEQQRNQEENEVLASQVSVITKRS